MASCIWCYRDIKDKEEVYNIQREDYNPATEKPKLQLHIECLKDIEMKLGRPLISDFEEQ